MMNKITETMTEVLLNHTTVGKHFLLVDQYLAMDPQARAGFDDSDLQDLKDDIRDGLEYFRIPELLGWHDPQSHDENLDLLTEILTNKVLNA